MRNGNEMAEYGLAPMEMALPARRLSYLKYSKDSVLTLFFFKKMREITKRQNKKQSHCLAA